jgi:alkylation response protein AidB-like acyl-CoA dehydrogenase
VDFGLTKSEKEMQKAAKAFAKGEFDKDMSLELDKKKEFPTKVWEKAGELGFIGMHFSEECSGQDLGLMESCIVIEEFCRKDSTLGSTLAFSSYGSESILKYGSDELKKKFLPEVAEGRMLSSCAFKENGKGYNFKSLSTTAVRDGDEWIINGEKTYVLNGGSAGFYTVLCQTDSDADITKGLSMFLVEADREGLVADDVGEKLGLRMIKTATIKLNNVRVPASNLIGNEGSGYKQIQEFFDINRIIIAAQAVGMAQGAFDRALDYVKQREQFGKKIAQFQITGHKIANLSTTITQIRLLTYNAAWNYDQGKNDSKLTAMAKLASTKAAVDVAAEAIQLFGGYGFMTEYEVERYYRDSKVIEIFEGNRGVQRDAIGKDVIGKIKK